MVNLEVSDDVIVERVAGRLSCPRDGRVFHTSFSPPRQAGRCDACGAELVQRPDDAAPVVRERLRVYREKTAPLVRFYEQQGVLHRLDGEAALETVFHRLEDLVPRSA